jgi:hypothetical protein
MAKIFMPEIPVDQRLLLMQQNADRIEETTYYKPLTQEELDLRREQLTDNAIKLSEYEDEKKDIMAGFKTKMDPLVKVNKLLMTEVKTRQCEVEGNLYHMANHEDSMMETYDANGEMISSRRLRPEEKQKNIFSTLKKAL